VECYNCHKKGHKRHDSWAKGGGKEGQGPRSRKGNTNGHRAHQAEQSELAFAASQKGLVLTKDSWLGDSGASTHIAAQRKDFVTYQELPPSNITGIGENTVTAIGKGNVRLNTTIDGRTFNIELKDVLHSPDLSNNLISISRLDDAGCAARFGSGKVTFEDPKGNVFAKGTKLGRLYLMDVKTSAVTSTAQAHVAVAHGWDDWHRIFGHLNMRSLKMLKDKEMVNGLQIDPKSMPSPTCKACVLAKQHHEPFPKESEREVEEIGDLTVSDLWGPARTTSLKGYRYYVSFTDVKSRRSMLYFAKGKDETLTKFEQYKAYMETQTGRKLKTLRCDNGGEYVNAKFKDFCAKAGIEMQTTAPHSPSQNGIAERLNRTIVERARAMLFSADLPKFLWPEAVAYSTYLKNRNPTRALKNFKTPHECGVVRSQT
jgi:transposase InsO family protein